MFFQKYEDKMLCQWYTTLFWHWDLIYSSLVVDHLFPWQEIQEFVSDNIIYTGVEPKPTEFNGQILINAMDFQSSHTKVNEGNIVSWVHFCDIVTEF